MAGPFPDSVDGPTFIKCALENISNVYKSAGAIRDLRTLLKEARQSHEASKLELAKMEAMYSEVFLTEVNVASSNFAQPDGAGTSSPPFVMRTGGGKTHIVAKRSTSFRAPSGKLSAVPTLPVVQFAFGGSDASSSS